MSQHTVHWAAWIALATLAMASQAQEKEFQVKGELKVGQHNVPMTAGGVYVIKVTTKGFQATAQVSPGFLRQTFPPFDVNRPIEANPPFEAVFVPEKTQVHLITVQPVLFGDPLKGPLNYELNVKPVPLAKAAVLEKKETLTVNDPKLDVDLRRGHHKAYVLPMKAGHTYLIEMIRKKQDLDDRMDPYLILENPGKKVVASDDDGAGNLNARIVYEAPTAGNYRILATTLGDNEVGEFTLTVRESIKK